MSGTATSPSGRALVEARYGEVPEVRRLLDFVRASERAERIYAAMCARGWK